jgi:vancomycin resistance protein YoaR
MKRNLQIFLWILFLSVILLTTIVSAYHVAYAGRIYPGVTVGKINLGNLSFDEAIKAIGTLKESSPISVDIKLTVCKDIPTSTVGCNKEEEKRVQWTWQELGFQIQPATTAKRAMDVGRRGKFIEQLMIKKNAWFEGVKVPLVWEWNEMAVADHIASLAAQIEISPEDPEIKIVDGKVQVNPGKDGYLIDKEELLRRLASHFDNLAEEEIPITVKGILNKLSEAEMEELGQRATALLTGEIALSFTDEAQDYTWKIAGTELISFLRPARSDGGINRERIASFTATLANSIDREAENAIFQMETTANDTVGRVILFKPARDGLELDRAQTANEIAKGVTIIQGNNKQLTIPLPVTRTKPFISNDSVNILGIKELLGRGISYFAGSIPGRIHNIELASLRISGSLVPPGETFSFNKAVGDVSTATGYQQAYIIKEGRTVLGDGGGVCQVSSTLYRAVLNAGLPIEERWAHAYRVHYYEEHSPVGQDATVYAPSVDLKFQNDTTAYVLVQTKMDKKQQMLTFELFGTSDGRKVEISKSRIWEQTAPPPDLYQDDPTLLIGVVKQIDFSAWGAKVAFDWTVTREDEVLQKRTFYSTYRPWQAVYLRGTKSQ